MDFSHSWTYLERGVSKIMNDLQQGMDMTTVSFFTFLFRRKVFVSFQAFWTAFANVAPFSSLQYMGIYT